MILNQNTEIIMGPPGTGKTAELIRIVIDLIASGVPPDQIGYISFTRQAVREASNRIVAATGRPRDEFIGFRTLHAMAYWLLGKKYSDIVDSENIREISWLPEHLDTPAHRSRTRVYSQLYSYHRTTGLSLPETWAKYGGKDIGTEEDFLEWCVLYKQHKYVNNKIDFTDLLREYVDLDRRFPFQYLFIDEAQDFSLDQWAAVQLLSPHADKVFVAGDSDQSIFGWSGAKSLVFDEIEGERRVLSQSYRVPEAPFLLASRCLEAMGRRPLYRPAPCKGSVTWLDFSELGTLPLNNGETWFILCRNNYQVKNLTAWLMGQQHVFRHVSEANSGTFLEKCVRHIGWYQEALLTRTLSTRRANLISEHCPEPHDAVAAGRSWQEAFSCWPASRIDYLNSTLADWGNPKIAIGSFHSSKGAEADNVVLLGDCTKKIYETLIKRNPEELRALYVAMTRTKNNLYLVQRQGRYGIPWEMFQRLPEDLMNGLL